MADSDDELRRMLEEDRARREAERAEEDARRADARTRIEQLFGSEGLPGFEQGRYFVLDIEELKRLRERNNVERPSGFGFLIDDLLTTALYQHSQIEETTSERDEIRAELESERIDVNEFADRLLDDLGLRVETEEDPRWLEDSDDPAELRECLRRHRLAAAAERMAHSARAVVAEIRVDPAEPTRSMIIVGTPTGDRAHERELAARLCRTMIALTMLSTYERNVVKGLHTLSGRIEREEIGALQAWSLVEAMLGREETEAPSIGR